MSDPILPVFPRYPKEAEIIGRLLAGYGELEFELCLCLGAALGDEDTAIRVMFRARGEEARIQIADALARPKFEAAGVGPVYWEAIADMGYCRQIRNQYAHCHWTETSNGLGFLSLEPVARKTTPIKLYAVCADAPLLEEQEAYFKYVQRCFWHLGEEYKKWAGRSASLGFPLPKKLVRPPMDNGPP
jgi:hypothetical protein